MSSDFSPVKVHCSCSFSGNCIQERNEYYDFSTITGLKWWNGMMEWNSGMCSMAIEYISVFHSSDCRLPAREDHMGGHEKGLGVV